MKFLQTYIVKSQSSSFVSCTRFIRSSTPKPALLTILHSMIRARRFNLPPSPWIYIEWTQENGENGNLHIQPSLSQLNSPFHTFIDIVRIAHIRPLEDGPPRAVSFLYQLMRRNLFVNHARTWIGTKIGAHD